MDGHSTNYILGHADDELQRLIDQARFYGDLTEQIFTKAGICPGMRVLDVGCGVGDVALLAVKLVGPSGSVVGVDTSGEALAIARERAATAQLANLVFQQGDLHDLTWEVPFDAVVGRLVLMYQADPVAAIRQVARYARPGGLIVFHEMDVTGGKAVPESPLYTQLLAWMLETLQRAGIETQMGLKLYQAFLAAGLPAPQLMLGARVEGSRDSLAYAYIEQTMKAVLPAMQQLGVTTAEALAIETLASRLREEIVAGGGVLVVPPLVGAWVAKAL